MENNDLLKAQIHRVYMRYLFPTVVGMITHTLYCLVDVYFVSVAAGANGLAAMNIAMPVFTIYTAVGLMFGVGGATTISVCAGAGDEETKHKSFTLAVIATLVAGIVLSVTGSVFVDQLCYAFGSTKELLPYVKSYVLPVNIACFAFILSSAMQVLIRSDNRPRLVMVALVSSNLMNIVLDYLMVVHLGWGIAGAAFATAVSPFLALSIMSTHFIRHHNQVKFVKNSYSFPLLKRIVSNGLASSVLELSAGAVIVFFNYSILQIGNELHLAAYAVITNIAYVGKGIFNGFSQALQPIVSVNYGAGKQERVRGAVRFGLICITGVAALIYAIFIVFPDEVSAVFANGDSELIRLSSRGVILYFSCLIFQAFNTMTMYYFQSIEKAVYSTCIAIGKGFVFILLGLFLLIPLWNIDGIWLTVTFAESLTCLLSLPFLIQTLKFKQ